MNKNVSSPAFFGEPINDFYACAWQYAQLPAETSTSAAAWRRVKGAMCCWSRVNKRQSCRVGSSGEAAGWASAAAREALCVRWDVAPAELLLLRVDSQLN